MRSLGSLFGYTEEELIGRDLAGAHTGAKKIIEEVTSMKVVNADDRAEKLFLTIRGGIYVVRKRMNVDVPEDREKQGKTPPWRRKTNHQ